MTKYSDIMYGEPKYWDDQIIVKVCKLHGCYAPLLEEDRCMGYCDSIALFTTFAEFFSAIAPKNVVVF